MERTGSHGITPIERPNKIKLTRPIIPDSAQRKINSNRNSLLHLLYRAFLLIKSLSKLLRVLPFAQNAQRWCALNRTQSLVMYSVCQDKNNNNFCVQVCSGGIEPCTYQLVFLVKLLTKCELILLRLNFEKCKILHHRQ